MTASPPSAASWIRADGDRVLVEVQAVPRASRTRLAGLHDGRLRIQLAAPPVDGEANLELERFVASMLGLPRSAVAVTGGKTGKRKTVAIRGLPLGDAAERLAALLPGAG